MDSDNTNTARSVQDVREQAKGYFANWIKIVDDKSRWTIKDFPYATGVPEQVENHCWRCITVNHCWFANENDKKPDEFDYSKYDASEIAVDDQGLYHPHCHCKKFAIRNPQPSDIQLIETEGKIGYMWKSKLHMYHLWGYSDDEKDAFVEMVAQKSKESYVSGDYEYQGHNQCGYKINCIIKIPSKNPELGKEIEMWSNWMVFPDGTLKCNSYLGGWDKK